MTRVMPTKKTRQERRQIDGKERRRGRAAISPSPEPVPTLLATAERKPPKAIEAEAALFADLGLAEAILDASPILAAVLNEQRQIVYCNRKLTELAGADDPRD